jgi:hypothetical protein
LKNIVTNSWCFCRKQPFSDIFLIEAIRSDVNAKTDCIDSRVYA